MTASVSLSSAERGDCANPAIVLQTITNRGVRSRSLDAHDEEQPAMVV
jgi:hypothetical protein